MKRILLVSLMASLVILPALGQDKDVKKEDTTQKKPVYGDNVYFETALENFEETVYTNKNLRYRVTGEQKASAAIRDVFPAPVKDSKKYLGIKMYGKRGDVYAVIPEKPLIIDKYCRSISMWVYGKRFSGELSIIIQDAQKNNHRLVMGIIDYLGWRKLTANIPSWIKQKDDYLNQKKFMKIIQIQYRPGNRSRLPKWQYYYIDDISVLVREKYTDRQSDDW